MQDLNESQLNELKAMLQKMLAELNEQLNISKQAADVVKLDQTTVGRISRMDALQQQSMAVSTRQKASLTLKKVQAALQAMSNQDYGYCRRCDELIAYNRLLAQPVANLCLACQDKADQQQ